MPTHRDTFSTYLRNPKSEHSPLDSMKTVDSVNVPKKINANGLTVGKTYTKPQLVKNDIVTSTKSTQCSISASRNEWLLDLCCSLQESALKALRLSNEKYEATMDKLKQQVAADGVNGSNTSLLVDYPPAFPPAKTPLPSDPLITEDAPPKPPPRHLSTQPPPLPPPPASHLRQKPRHGYAQPVTEYAPRHVPSPQYLCGASPASKIYDYRHSPSSGFYSCSAGSPSPSSVSLESDNAPQGAWDNAGSALVTQFVKSTQVPKPLLQTACAPINDPPSYASTMQQRNSSPPLKHHSPIPERRCKPLDCKVRNYSPQAFKFFMEQHVENVLKSYKQRIFRRMQLESEMAKIRLPEQARNQMRKMLCQKESNYIRLRRAKMDKSMFNSIRVIGVGAFGEVALVRKIDTNHLYAMKTLRKADVLKRKQVAHVKAERDILAEADNEWVVKLYYSFQDNDNLYFIMEYIPGGDLMSLLIKLGIFDEPLAKFYLAELTCAVESVHKIGFIHRDIKPDNILIDRDGHIKLTDFGLCTGFRWTHNSKYYNNDQHNRQNSLDFNDTWTQNTVNCKCSHLKPLERRRRREHQRCQAHSLVGTPNYIAPEVLLRTGYTQLCDWWSVGVVLYEMLVGAPPFAADSPSETQYKIINWKNTLKIPPNSNVSAEGIDLILKLCTSQDQRLGKNVDEVKQHPFFAGVNFDKGVRKTTPPYIPTIHYLTDTSNFDSIDQSSLHESNSATSDYSEASDDDKAFHGFFEFTFRRFFDDAGGGIPFHTKITSEESDNQIAIYV